MMRVLKFIGKALLALVALGAIALVGFYAADPLYHGRILRLPFIDQVKDVDFYSPLEVVKGNPAPALPRAADGEKTITPEGWNRALDYAKKMDSLSLVVWQGGKVQYEYYRPDFKPEDRTDPASMHKSVVALLVGQLLADGYIKSIDDPVANYVSEWANDARKNITIRHLLTMSSGLYRQPFSASPSGHFLRLNLGTEIRDLTLSIPAEEEPGKVFAYYNFNPQMLAILIERTTGKRYAQYLSERLWSKLGTKDAYVFLDHEGGLARAYCCLQMSAEDWLRVGLLHLNKGKVGDEQVVAEDWMRQVTTPSAVNPNYGFQTWLGTTYEPLRGYGKGVSAGVPHSEPFAAPDVIYFDGAGGQRLYVIPSKDLVIVRMGKTGIDLKTGNFLFDDAIIPNALIRGVIAKPEAAATP
ncbi:MAG: serine hydrolase [Rhodospirillaceae bacterium]|nr:serine hydrolase [Rhodospirillaceae bacterium]